MFDKYEKNGAYHYDWYNSSAQLWYKECVDMIVAFCTGSTLDVGGGDGLVAKKIQEQGYMTIVLDNNRTASSICHEYNVNFQFIDLDIISDLGVSFEYLACLNTIEHLKSPSSIIAFIQNNITKGAIIITDKATNNLGRYHEHEYTKKELLETFKEFTPEYFEINSTENGIPITFIGIRILK